MVQADLGEVTGAQASIYGRREPPWIMACLLSLWPNGVTPGCGCPKVSIKALVRSALTELVAELGTVGGPRLQRVDDYFFQLLGPTPGEHPSRQNLQLVKSRRCRGGLVRPAA